MSSKSVDMRAILSVSDKTGLVELGRGLAARGRRARLDRRHRQGARRRRVCRSSTSPTSPGFPEMMDGRVKTLHPADPRRHPGPAPPSRRPRRRSRATASRSVDLVVVNLYPFAKAAAEPRHAVRRAGRGDRHRRPEPGPRRGQELPRRPGRRRSGRLSAGARGAGARRRAVAGVPLRADAEGVRAHRRSTTR